MSNHTPGPWYQLYGDHGRREISNSVTAHWASNEHYIGSVNAENAALVAAAPELLEACQRVLRVINPGDLPGPVYLSLEEKDLLRCAVEKAEGSNA